jgi:segregation and condensation protein A
MAFIMHIQEIAPNITPPLATINGQALAAFPQDLYIPPDALEVILENFSGPLDLLLYLIRKQNLDILNIPIAQITYQYQQYINLMQILKMELVAEYLLMAAVLAEIKSRLLLPRSKPTSEEEEDPRAQLVQRLKEYEQFKLAAQALDDLPRVERDILPISLCATMQELPRRLPEVQLLDLTQALVAVLSRQSLRTPHLVYHESLSIRQRMGQILEKIQGKDFVGFAQLFCLQEGRMGVVVTLIAILELLKQTAIEIVQVQAYALFYIKSSFS